MTLDLAADTCSDGLVWIGLGGIGIGDGGLKFAAGSDHARPSGRGGEQTFCMTTLTGILEWPQRADGNGGRVRQLNGSTHDTGVAGVSDSLLDYPL